MNNPQGKLSRRRPFWFSAVNYYVLSIAVAAAVFFLLWGVLHDGGEEIPWVTAGLAGCIVLAGAVFLREFIFRVSYNRQIADQRRLDRNLRGIRLKNSHVNEKLTMEQNAALLDEIIRKSEAAKILARMPEGHREVFEICDRYLSVNSSELSKVSPASPRLPALLKGKDLVESFHRFHLLRWAEIESRSHSAEAKHSVRATARIEAAQKAISVIDSALHFYPAEQDLLQSREALIELLASIKIENWMERAERAALKGNYRQARKLYKDALLFLERNGKSLEKTAEVAARIREDVATIDTLESQKGGLIK